MQSRGMRSGRDLRVFTTGAEFFYLGHDLEPITPNNIVLKSATKRGSKEGIRPTAAETGTLFIQRQGKTLREMLFSDVELSYVSNNISLLSSHMIVDPIRMSLRPATETQREGDLLLIVNGERLKWLPFCIYWIHGWYSCFYVKQTTKCCSTKFFTNEMVLLRMWRWI